MTTRHDRELEEFKRTIDLVDYARKAGYEPKSYDGAPGLTVLHHPNRDRIVVAQSPSGPWMYASVPDYAPRAPAEPAEEALSRLRHSIHNAKDKGSIVEFVQQRDWTARRGEVPLELARERLREFHATGRPLDFDGALRPPPYTPRLERSADPSRDGPPPGAPVATGEAITRRGNAELNQRRYDWSPPIPNAPRETQVDERLRQWREAQAAIDLKVGGSREVVGRAQPPAPAAVPPPARDPRRPSLPERPSTDRNEALGPKKNSELNRRRYDWTPEPPGLEAIRRAARGPSTGRER
jgi:hypothetical protein